MAWLLQYTYHPQFRGLVLRRNSEDLRDWADRADQLYSQLENPAVKRGNPPEYRFRSGAIIRTGHLNDEDAYTKYQGHEYQLILIEELTQIPQLKQYLRILSSARSVIPELVPQVFLTTNPGGKGHLWVKERFVDPAQPGTTIWENGRSRVFIPATMDDNPTLMDNDPQYVANIESLKESDYETYMAWRYGDWDRFAGQVFKEFNRAYHVIEPVLPTKGNIFLWMDWGYSENSAFAAYLSTVIEQISPRGEKYNQVITFREWYDNQKDPEEWARIIYKDCNKMGIKPELGIADPAMFNPKTDGSTSISNMMTKEWQRLNKKLWISLIKGNNTRTGRIGGVAIMHKWLSKPHTLPYWVMTSNCTNLIRTLPALVHDENNVEDVDTEQEDHAYDACRYGLSQVKFIAIKPGSYAASPLVKKQKLHTDERGLPVINPHEFFGRQS